MNVLTLRINPSGNKKTKSSIGFAPVDIPNYENEGFTNILFDTFTKSATADEQLGVMKKILDESKGNPDPIVMKFLAIVFLQAESKHLVKCFLTRHITKNESIQVTFTDKLSIEIMSLISRSHNEYHSYINVVSKVATCMENFPAGAAAVKAVELELAAYLVKCLECCITTLSGAKTLSPTEKNEIFNLAHLALRLILYIVQKVKESNISHLMVFFGTLRVLIKALIFDDDAPMDTKSVCGILYLTMNILEFGSDAWINILDSNQTADNLKVLLENEAAQLSLYSAIVTVVAAERLQAQVVGDQAAVIILTEKVMAIGERCSSESAFILGATRSLVQVGKMLPSTRDKDLGLALTERLLTFVWGHLEHYMDSVRHLTAQALATVVRYCTALENEGDDTALTQLVAALSTLDRSRKSYYVCLGALTSQLGARRLLRRLPDVIGDVIHALSVQPVQASAATALDALLQSYARELDASSLHEAFIVPLVRRAGSSTSCAALQALEGALASAVALSSRADCITSLINEYCDASATSPSNLKCILLLLSVARKSGVAGQLGESKEGHWKGIISYDVLEAAVVDAVEETRVLCLSLVCESPKSTEVFALEELSLVLRYLHYNANAQSPNFRQLTLSLLKKFLKRLEDSYKVLKRQKEPTSHNNKGDYYLEFLDELRDQCFASLVPGANYSRRYVTLQLLAWTDQLTFEGYQRRWTEDYVDKLLLRLEDSYENNKALALQVLESCPQHLLQGKKYRVSLVLEDILQQASSLKPTDCVSAAYKLNFLTTKLPEYIVKDTICTTTEPVLFCLLSRLLGQLRQQVAVSRESVVSAARRAPMYGLVHCMGHVMLLLDPSAISSDEQWTALVADMIETCVCVNESVSGVVNNSSPEGHLPMDRGVYAHDRGNSGGVRLEDGRPVTAQMVLLCAWRSVKEVSLLLGTIASRLTVSGEGLETGTLSRRQMALIGEHFTSLLAETKHRGAFEQAYVGFTKLLARLWRCRSSLHELPASWMQQLTAEVSRPTAARSATRRSAGLPFMIQALVTTELQVQGNPKCLHECMTTLLRLARSTNKHSSDSTKEHTVQKHKSIDSTLKEQNKSKTNKIDSTIETQEPHQSSKGDSTVEMKQSTECKIESSHIESLSEDNQVETRTHSLNILRALFRNSVLEESVAGYVGEGLQVALEGFDRDTWIERNSCTLLFSALMVRVFGVARRRGTDPTHPPRPNHMTGRIFFLRYPALYDFIMNKLKEAESTIEDQLHPSLYPILILLGRLYPSSLEGTVSNLRLSALAPLVRSVARARALHARQRAAAAALPLIPALQYLPHLESLLTTISDRSIKTNHCHGILLQMTTQLASPPEHLRVPRDSSRTVSALNNTSWVLEQAASERPCYLLADEYVKMINLIVWRFPSFMSPELISHIEDYLNRILFTEGIPRITSGREVCLANAIYLYYVLLTKYGDVQETCELILKGLSHNAYEVVLSTLNYLLILYKSLDIENCTFQTHLSTLTNDNNILIELRNKESYLKNLCNVFQKNKYLECTQKSLKLLTLERETQKYIVSLKLKRNVNEISDEEIVNELFDCVRCEHENLTHIYLESLSNFVSERLEVSSLNKRSILEVIRVVFECSSSENNDRTREVVAKFLESNLAALLDFDMEGFTDEEKFEFKSTLWATAVIILEDDDATVRQRAADILLSISSGHKMAARVIPSRAAEILRDLIEDRERGEERIALFVVLALLDFKSEVCMADEINDEYRVFDQNERYNIFLEESVWTDACAGKILLFCEKQNVKALDLVQTLIEKHEFKGTFDKLCNNNLDLFKKSITDKGISCKGDVLNPKIELFLQKIS